MTMHSHIPPHSSERGRTWFVRVRGFLLCKLERLSITAKVALAPAVALGGLCLVALMVQFTMSAMVSSLEHLDQERMPAYQAALYVDAELDALARLVDRSVIWEGAGFKAANVAALDNEVTKRLRETRELLQQSTHSQLASERELGQRILPLFDRYERSVLDTLDLKSTGLPTVAGALTNSEDIYKQIKATIGEYVRTERIATKADLAEVVFMGRRIQVVQLAILALAIGLSYLTAWLVIRSITYLAEHDALTGLKSRNFIELQIDSHIRGARDGELALTLMYVDLDGFKAVNDRWGHAAGDAVLVEVGRRLSALFKRAGDVVGRLGGDELVVLIDDVHANDPTIARLARTLVELLKQPFSLPNGEVATIGASVGLASYPLHADSTEALIDAADAAMYQVKKAGKSGYLVATLQDAATAAEQNPIAMPGQVDVLTGLPDRRALGQRLEQVSQAGVLQNGMVAVVCMDIIQFKTVNLVHGPESGDAVLCEMAHRLRNGLRQGDMVARTGSDEFVALLSTAARDKAAAQQAVNVVIGKIRRLLADPFVVGHQRLQVDVSMGVSFVDPLNPDAMQVLREAQLALQKAKTNPPEHVQFFEARMLDGFMLQHSLEEELRHAVQDQQLQLYVQPQVDHAGRVCGGEALLRWQHPQRGWVSPVEFIPLAESSGSIIEIGRWVLQEGCRILARMHAQGQRGTLAVNISPLQFNHPDFVADVRFSLTAAGAPAEALILEITEGLLLTDITQVSAKLGELATAGVRFSIDDFGTGFSSLSYLRQLPLHEIKIDRSFIAGLPGDQANVGIVQSILAMGRHLGLNVVAEGVETQAQCDFLRTLDCPMQQGWLHGRPGPAAEWIS